MDETIRWLQGRPYYEGQVRERRTIPGREATYRDLDLDSRLERALAADGIERLYAHQAEAVAAVRDRNDVVLATPTASGKTLAYAVPAFERALDERATTLYVAPQVALINDQAATLSEYARRLGFGSGVQVDVYTGRQDRSEKEAIRERQPTVLLTTPDMLHYGILPHAHRLWDWFFERLETVVVDEVHEYRGVFGSHVSLVFRRLARICERFAEGGPASADGHPDWVCCSATIGNPVDHAATVTGQDPESFVSIEDDRSATGPTHWLLWNPPEYEGGGFGSGRRRSSHVETKHLFVDLVDRGLQTVAFTRSRQTAERYATESRRELRSRGEREVRGASDGTSRARRERSEGPDEANGDDGPVSGQRPRDRSRKVHAYQAALTDERRVDIEDGLKSGDVRGVWSTNALELGVDIGGLDAVLLDGYPGTRMAAFQQAGRAGRGTDPSLVVMVAGEDQLDQYLMRHPADFFDEPPEQAVSNPENRRLLPDHVRAAARETWLRPDDDRHFGAAFPDVVADLTDAGDLDRRTTEAGLRWLYDGGGSPQHEMGLRTVGDREIRLRDRRGGDAIAALGFADALRDAHPGAVYHHQGQDYEVVDLDLRHDVADLAPVDPDYYTQVLHEKTITVEDDRRERTLPDREDVAVRFADVTMRKQITGFERRDRSSGDPIGRESLDLPETTLETEALYFTVPDSLRRDIEANGNARDAFPGAIHAVEHGMISLFPLSFLCDRRDIGGLSTPRHPHTDESTIFVYDGYPGGVGLNRRAYERIADLMRRTLSMIRDCPCADGCPACVQSPHCGNANDPLEKDLAADLLAALVE